MRRGTFTADGRKREIVASRRCHDTRGRRYERHRHSWRCSCVCVAQRCCRPPCGCVLCAAASFGRARPRAREARSEVIQARGDGMRAGGRGAAREVFLRVALSLRVAHEKQIPNLCGGFFDEKLAVERLGVDTSGGISAVSSNSSAHHPTTPLVCVHAETLKGPLSISEQRACRAEPRARALERPCCCARRTDRSALLTPPDSLAPFGAISPLSDAGPDCVITEMSSGSLQRIGHYRLGKNLGIGSFGKVRRMPPAPARPSLPSRRSRLLLHRSLRIMI